MKHACWVFVAVFLSLQTFSIAHAAKYGFEPHKHGGQVCEIFILGDKSKFAVAAFSTTPPVSQFHEVRISGITELLLSKDIYKGTYARAPPAVLQS